MHERNWLKLDENIDYDNELIRYWVSQVKGWGHYVTKYGQTSAWEPQLCSNFSKEISYWGPNFKGHGHHMTRSMS